MQQLELLWLYQRTDIKVVRYENEMRQYPMRSKLLRLRNMVADQQTTVKAMENDAASSLERLDNMKQLQESFSQLQKSIEQKLADENAFETSDQVRRDIQQLQEIENKLKGFEKDLQRMEHDSKLVGARYKEIRQNNAKAREEYTKLKAQYDIELAKQNEKLAALKEQRTKAAEGIDEAIMQRYTAIRSQIFPPIATLKDDLCSGCNMSLPAVVTQSIRDLNSVTTCENCGRILIPAQEKAQKTEPAAE